MRAVLLGGVLVLVVIARGLTISPASAASISVTPTVVVAGSTVTLSGDVLNFLGQPGGELPGTVLLFSVAFGDQNVPIEAPAAADGSFSVQVTIPADVAPGTYTITARSGGGNLGGIAALLVVLAADQAQHPTVCASACPFSTLQAAIAAAAVGDTITAETGLYQENLLIDHTALTIVGLDGPVIVDGGGDSAVVEVNPEATATLVNMTLQNGGGGYGNDGGGIWNRGTLTLVDCTVSNNVVYSRAFGGGGLGGGIWSDGTLTLIGSTVSNNIARGGEGGGIENAGIATLTNSTVSSNTASEGGGIFNSGTLTLTNSTVSGNIAFTSGGIYNGGGTLTLLNSTLSANSPDNCESRPAPATGCSSF